MRVAVTAIGLVFVFEGLVLALAPSRMEQALEWLASLPRDRRRMLGLAGVAAGVALVWLALHLGA